MISFAGRHTRVIPAAVALLSGTTWHPAWAQAVGEGAPQAETEAQPAGADGQPVEEADLGYEDDSGSGTDIFSADTFSVILDARLVLADGANSWVDGGFGKTRFDGTDDADYEFDAY